MCVSAVTIPGLRPRGELRASVSGLPLALKSRACPSCKMPQSEWILWSKSDFPVLELEIFCFSFKLLPSVPKALNTVSGFVSRCSYQLPRGSGGPGLIYRVSRPLLARAGLNTTITPGQKQPVRAALFPLSSRTRRLVSFVCAHGFYFISLQAAKQKQNFNFSFSPFPFLLTTVHVLQQAFNLCFWICYVLFLSLKKFYEA